MNETNSNKSAGAAVVTAAEPDGAVTNAFAGVVETQPPAPAPSASGAGAAPPAAPQFPTAMVVWAVILVVLLVVAKKKGWLDRLRAFFLQTREELRKCTWPNKEEMRGSTIMVLVAVALLGGFTFAADYFLGGFVIQDLLLNRLAAN